jgi:hypothetical protein
MRPILLIALLIFGANPSVQAQKSPKPPVIYAPPITPDDGKTQGAPTAPQQTTTLPLNPVDVDVKITELLLTTKGKPFVLPALPAAGAARDDLALIKSAASHAKLPVAENSIGEADAPDGGVGSSSRTEVAPAGFITFPDGHQGYNPAAIEQSTTLSLKPKLQKDKLLQIELRLSFSEITPTAKTPKPKPRDFHPPVVVLVTAHPGDTVFLGPPITGKTTERLLFATVTILPLTSE